MALIDGPRLPPAAGGPPQSLVVLLHGYGSNGEDLIGLAPYWAKLLPYTQFVSPHAPEPTPLAPGGRQWFAITRLDPHERDRGVERHFDTLNRFFDQELQRYGLGEGQLALVGFSQGAMMALHVGLRRQSAPAGLIAYSGALAQPGALKAQARCRPPILLAHGDRDDVIPAGAMFEAGQALAQAGLSAQWVLSPGVAHSISEDALRAGGAFLRDAFKGRYRSLALGPSASENP